ncbi:hypothetical protein LJC58_03805 [Lachnospiraceae bacterium OttesenSCG-928-D06]|nr:hypothetical protein [Lachnospiraceae bacterium OttesenSCG-928-D06]
MLKFNSIGQIEHGTYPFKDAITSADTFNGAFGEIVDGKFTPSANATKAIMQIERGDNSGLPKYPISKKAHVRVIDLKKLNGQSIEVYDYPLPDTYAVGDKLTSDANGGLVTSASAAPYLEITEVIGNKQGIVATIVTE